jgi:anti-sigma regulatory factor (Ser/Thr protein kinase)
MVEWRYARHPGAVRDARMDVAAACRRFDVAGLSATAVLATSELVTNAIRYARGEVTVRLIAGPSSVRLEVTDDFPTAPLLRAPALDAESGRGLLIVKEIAERWGTAPTNSGKTVWCEITS